MLSVKIKNVIKHQYQWIIQELKCTKNIIIFISVKIFKIVNPY